MKNILLSATLLLATLSLLLPPEVRSQATQGVILGTVTDASGAGVPGAKTTIRNEGTQHGS